MQVDTEVAFPAVSNRLEHVWLWGNFPAAIQEAWCLTGTQGPATGTLITSLFPFPA